jgi:hypothetical protein
MKLIDSEYNLKYKGYHLFDSLFMSKVLFYYFDKINNLN